MSKRKYKFKNSRRSDFSMHKIYFDLKYLIHFHDVHFNDLWLFPCTKKMLYAQFNDIKMTSAVKLANAYKT